MSTLARIFVLSLAIGLLQACATRTGQLSTDSITPAESSPPSRPLEQEAAEVSSAKTEARAEHSLAPERSDVQNADTETPVKSERQATKKRPVALRSESSASKKLAGPLPEDPFLRWLEKDLLKGIDQPLERIRLEFSKAVMENPRVRHFINQFSKSGKNDLEKALARSGKYIGMIGKILHEEGVPEELAYLALIESGFLIQSISPSGAVGLWQFVAGTARQYGLRIDAWVDERRDPEKSTRAAAAYLKDLHEHFGRWYLALAAYNAGQGAIEKAMQSSGATDFWTLSVKAQLKDETRNFVPKFVAAALIANDPQKYGFETLDYEAPLDYEEVEVQGSLRLATFAKMAGTDLETVRELNPALKRNQIPWTEGGFRVKLPTGQAMVFASAYQEQASRQGEVVTHEVRKGETLFAIARRYGQRVNVLMELNGLANPTLRVGQKLKIMIEGLRGGIR